MFKKLLLISVSSLLLVGCGPKKTDPKTIRIASHTAPMTTVIEIAKEILAKDGYTLELVSVSDNTAGNVALHNKEVDANFFQHAPFMESFNQAHKANLVAITPIYDAIVGYYAKDITSIEDIPVGAKVGIPNDLNNQARALVVLEQHGLIALAVKGSETSTVEDVVGNPLKLEFIPVDMLSLSNTYQDVDLLFNYPTYISAIGLTPLEDALMLETSNAYFAISLVAREDNQDSEKIKVLKDAMTSQEVKDFLTNEVNKQTLIPSF